MCILFVDISFLQLIHEQIVLFAILCYNINSYMLFIKSFRYIIQQTKINEKLLTFLLLFFILTLNAATFKDADLNRDGSLCIEEIRLSNLDDLEKDSKILM